ncbi:MAG TPA: ABC transporter substrate-binding protein [Acidimicrobiia bacterium]|nr:ABC transporter substrate-binding protein [Acidimicrobiia bacterium]
MRARAVLLLTALAVLATACTGTAEEATTTLPTEVGDGEGKVVIVAWAGYIERGDYDPAFDWVTEFEADTGCLVEHKIAGTSDEMVALMTGSEEYDLVTASGDASLRLVAGGSVQEINIDLIESWDTVDPRLQDAEWHTVDGKHYGVPYTSGFNVLGFNSEIFGDTPPDSWSVVFEETTFPDGASNQGRIQAYDGPIYIADAALYLKSTNPELGIEDPYQLNEEQYQAALDLLRIQRTLVGRYWHDAYIQMDDFKNEGVAASSTWPFQTGILASEGFPIDKVVPKEGATGWADTTMMNSKAPHPNCAYMWMEHSLNPKLQGDLAYFFGTVPAVLAACEGNEFLGPDGCAYNGSEQFDEILFWKTPTDDCNGTADPGTCVPYYRWVTDYLAVIGGR